MEFKYNYYFLLLLLFTTINSLNASININNIANNYFTKYYKHTNKDIKYLQIVLNTNLNSKKLKIDGDYGLNTKQAVKLIQKEYNLKNIDAIIGKNTKILLDKLLIKSKFYLTSIISIKPKIIKKTKDKQIIKIYGNNFTKNTKVKWYSSTKSSGIIKNNHIKFISKNEINLNINLGIDANYWKFSIINDKNESSKLIKVYFKDYGVSKKDKFLYLPIKGSHSSIDVSSVFDHNNGKNVEAFNGLIAKKKYGVRSRRNSTCYKTKSKNNIVLPGIKYKGVSNQKKYLCYDGHHGIDYAVALNTKVYAAAAGIIVAKKYSHDAGYYLIINHGNGYASAYMHLAKNNRLNIGTHVTRKTQIAYSSNSGHVAAHLHFEIRANYTKNIYKEDSFYKKVDPFGYKGKNILWANWKFQ